MKTLLFRVAFIVYLLIFQFSNFTWCQSQYLGNWEGVFMNDFKTIIELNSDENGNFLGKIEMFSGSNKIQDDQISNISISENRLTFRINAKDTDFKGEFNSSVTEITGVFIFPDKSEHPLKLVKGNIKESAQESSAEIYQDLKNKKYPVDELKEDLNFLMDKLAAYHPQLYLYTSREEFDSCVDEILNSITRELTIVEFYDLIAPLVEIVKCSHTGIRLPQNYQKGIYVNEKFFPLKLLFTGNKAFCLNNYDNANRSVNPGDEIVSINGIPIQKIKEKLYQFIPSEGSNQSTKNYQLNKNFNTWFNLIDNSDQFAIEFVKEDEQCITSIAACNYSVFEETNESSKNELPVNFIYDKLNNLGILTVRSFMIGDINQYIQKMDEIFDSLQNENTQQLLIDLRGNSGGHPIFAAQLFSYLTDQEFIYFKRNSEIKEFEPLYNKMQASELNFEGDIYVLVDGGCLSTTGHLISLIKYHTNAIFVGQEPGSTYRCNDFSTQEILPNTKLEVNIPRTTFETAVSESFKSVPFKVDISMSYSKDDCLSGVDSYLKFINNLILKP